jgi:hypothetical protein
MSGGDVFSRSLSLICIRPEFRNLWMSTHDTQVLGREGENEAEGLAGPEPEG